MKTNQILTADYLDILFDGKNKSYGAYELRKNYNKRMSLALVLLFVVAALALWFIRVQSGDDDYERYVFTEHVPPIMQLSDLPKLKKEEPELQQPKAEAPKQEAAASKIIQEEIKFTEPKPVEKPIDVPPTNAQLKDIKIGESNIQGPKTEITTVTPQKLEEVKGVEGPTEINKDEILREVDELAAYDGNWAKFLKSSLNASVPIDNGAEPGSYSVKLQFVVDENGVISDITPLTNIGFGMEKEAIRVIKKSKKWKPAKQNNKAVKAYRFQTITFVVTDY